MKLHNLKKSKTDSKLEWLKNDLLPMLTMSQRCEIVSSIALGLIQTDIIKFIKRNVSNHEHYQYRPYMKRPCRQKQTQQEQMLIAEYQSYFEGYFELINSEIGVKWECRDWINLAK